MERERGDKSEGKGRGVKRDKVGGRIDMCYKGMYLHE